jgi:hypothetical protein
MGNHPITDIMVVSPKGVQFLIDVKGLHRPNFWPVHLRDKSPRHLFYVFALVPDGVQNRFFVLTADQVREGVLDDWEKARARRKAKGLPGDPGDFKCVAYKFAERYEDKWDALPQ